MNKNTQNTNLISKTDRLNTAVAYLKGKRIAKTQKAIAKMLETNEVTLSRALNGNEDYVTDPFLRKFADIFEINTNWLLTGEGEMINEESIQTEIITSENTSIPQTNDTIEGILDVVTLLFAQVNTQDKSLLFIQDQILKLVKKQDEMNKDMKELMKLINKTTAKS
ncbi:MULTISPECIES: helix-turn-helix domain-containing protein [Elizabethkingia]|uniref:helix-turn-helix domain-containing protein n=1 Tax=Elizabethkingia TaxID=308865 RepID=UPI0021A71B6B|nr:helix-turn-helix domain-containing protein [Elizabethkingia sp. HX CGY]MCT3689524.1 helix-turn-helix transcriptional regulator [Elizabethkingia anophelis]MCT3706386.1 helix-turn-helix transcriptional regulator [Elizabethkingia anophelis]MCT3713405.1 helix-turn-helix transcriptional regulator [Elizabethkingia anophelis]MCT3716824.1 helix-turn-helix transcriptional regulator [Elizabethkingia anophelis]MCT3730417.1 helix-turn-helix transcriptional regulator [Elizabethkingia anophelis]